MKAYIFEMYIEKAPSSMPNNSDNISHLFLTFENIFEYLFPFTSLVTVTPELISIF